MEKIILEVPWEYRETMDFLKQVLAGKDGGPIQSDNDLAEILITWFMSFIEDEMLDEMSPEWEHQH